MRIVAVPNERIVDQRVLHIADDRCRRVDLADLFDRQGHHEQRAAGAAILLGDLDPHQSKLEIFRQQSRIDPACFLHLRHARTHLFLGERRDGVAEHRLFFREERQRW